jgi:hypothetical protein
VIESTAIVSRQVVASPSRLRRDPCEIYTLGAKKVDDVLDWSGELAVPAATLCVFSTDKSAPARRSGLGTLEH